MSLRQNVMEDENRQDSMWAAGEGEAGEKRWDSNDLGYQVRKSVSPSHLPSKPWVVSRSLSAFEKGAPSDLVGMTSQLVRAKSCPHIPVLKSKPQYLRLWPYVAVLTEVIKLK
jgi:hypothetical protein